MAMEPLPHLDYDDPDVMASAKRAARLVWDDYRRSRDFLVDDLRDQWEILFDAWLAYHEETDDSTQSDLVRPVIFSQIGAFVPRIVANNPRIEVHGRSQEDEVRAAMHRAKLFYDWDHMGMPEKLVSFATSAMIFGAAWMKVSYRKEMRKRLVREVGEVPRTIRAPLFDIATQQPVDQEIETGTEPGLVKTLKRVAIWDDPEVDLLELDEVFPDPDMRSLDDPGSITIRYPVTLAELENCVQDGKPLYDKAVIDKIRAKVKKGGGNKIERHAEQETLRQRRQKKWSSDQEPTRDPHKAEWHLLERWTDEKVIAILEEDPELPVRNERNEIGMRPLALYTPIPIPNELYGVSPASVLYANQVETSSLGQARMDHVMYSAHPVQKVVRSANVSNQRRVPGGRIYVDSMDDVGYDDPPRLDFAMHRESEDLRMWAQLSLGGTDPFLGLNSQTGGTATEATLLAQAAGTRAGLMYQLLGKQTFQRLGRLLIRLNELYAPKRILRVAGTAFEAPEGMQELPGGRVEIDPMEMAGGSGRDLDVVIDISETEPETTQFKRSQATNLLQVAGGIFPPFTPIMQPILEDALRSSSVPNPGPMIAQSLQMLFKLQQQAAAAEQQADPSAAVSSGDQLAESTASVAPNSGGGGGRF